MQERSIIERLQVLEKTTAVKSHLTTVEVQLVQLRDEMCTEFSATREQLRVEMRVGHEEARHYMRLLHEEVIARLDLMDKAVEEAEGGADAKTSPTATVIPQKVSQ